MTKILAIGNSFSQDATAYLYDIAAAGAICCKVVNLYIGGCSLYTHWQNAVSNEPNYVYELNGKWTDRMTNLRDALAEDTWDIVTLQQASHDSGLRETYFPYIHQLAGYVRELAPSAKLYIHQTWAYELDSDHGAFERYGHNQVKMYAALTDCYDKAAKALQVPLIPCGKVIQTLRANKLFDYASGGQSLCRDGFHLHIPYGRYAAAATWYEILLGGNILQNDYQPEAGQIDEHKIDTIRRVVHEVCT